MTNTTFYTDLPSISHFADITDLRHYWPLPPDWQIVITDVKGSTTAIRAGRYKEVNMIGAASIVALLNIAGTIEIPFIFGGDGATLAIPPELLEPTRKALAALQALSLSAFELELRTGIVPVQTLLDAGQEVRVACVQVSEHYKQAAFNGGLSYAEQLVKDPVLGRPFLIPAADHADDADLTGLECRWEDIPSRYGETISLLVAAAPNLPAERRIQVIAAAITQIETIYGNDANGNPLSVRQLKASTDPRQLMGETRLRAAPRLFARLRYLLKIFALNISVMFYRMYQQLRGLVPWWDRYRELVFRTADYRKFDDTLRMVLAGTAEQRAELEQFLDTQYHSGELVYGIHVSDRALMTCLVFERMGRQVHFVDAADGGYAMAARELKARLSALSLYPADP